MLTREVGWWCLLSNGITIQNLLQWRIQKDMMGLTGFRRINFNLDEWVLASCYTFQLHTTKKGGEKQTMVYWCHDYSKKEQNKTKNKQTNKKNRKSESNCCIPTLAIYTMDNTLCIVPWLHKKHVSPRKVRTYICRSKSVLILDLNWLWTTQPWTHCLESLPCSEH